MKKSSWLFGAGALALVLAAPALAASLPANVKIESTAKGKVFTDAQGMSFYTFAQDKVGSSTSACTGACASYWPPVAAPAGFTPSGNWNEITRADGTKQLTWKGWPLYTYKGDSAAGQTNGDGYKGLWALAKPVASSSTTSSGAASSHTGW